MGTKHSTLLEAGAGGHGQASEARLSLLGRMLSQLIGSGRLTVVDAAGRRSMFGSGGDLSVRIRLHDPMLPIRLAFNPVLAAGEAYMDGRLTFEEGGPRELLLLAAERDEATFDGWPAGLFSRIQKAAGWLAWANDGARARRNVERHYDIPTELYDLFLDEDRVYSCGYFRDGGETLAEAQQAKLRHICAKLCLRPGDRVLDIGSGWGALATAIATDGDCSVKGITLSRPQRDRARERAARLGLTDRVSFELLDYRDERDRFDRVVSVGMLEHVGLRRLGRYFAKVRDLLHQDGVALIHSIGRADTRSARNAWINRYIFPGGYIPSLSETTRAAEQAGLWVTDIEILRMHYAETLRCWSERFRANREAARAMLGERFCRMWEFYLAVSEAAFRHRTLMVFQMQLARRRDAVPLTRDYIAEHEGRIERTEV
jgi:cyclopropane-fatty-acyl-phospholipid synthase